MKILAYIFVFSIIVIWIYPCLTLDWVLFVEKFLCFISCISLELRLEMESSTCFKGNTIVIKSLMSRTVYKDENRWPFSLTHDTFLDKSLQRLLMNNLQLVLSYPFVSKQNEVYTFGLIFTFIFTHYSLIWMKKTSRRFILLFFFYNFSFSH